MDEGSLNSDLSKMDSLKSYREKRNFGVTSEPPGEKASYGDQIFVVQKHNARSLHYDLRLVVDGVLKSFAVPKGPSMNPKDKRLAIQTEDHPLEYAFFEGTIPKGQYGAGTVIVWDKGPLQKYHPKRRPGHLNGSGSGKRPRRRLAGGQETVRRLCPHSHQARMDLG